MVLLLARRAPSPSPNETSYAQSVLSPVGCEEVIWKCSLQEESWTDWCLVIVRIAMEGCRGWPEVAGGWSCWTSAALPRSCTGHWGFTNTLRLQRSLLSSGTCGLCQRQEWHHQQRLGESRQILAQGNVVQQERFLQILDRVAADLFMNLLGKGAHDWPPRQRSSHCPTGERNRWSTGEERLSPATERGDVR